MVNQRERIAACVLVAAAWLALVFIGWKAYSPPSPRAVDCPENEFSAERARVILKDLVGDGIPHPNGSAQNAVVRERVLKYFRAFGYEPEVQVAPTTMGNVVNDPLVVRNIVVRRRGLHPGRAIMLAGHYDSVSRGPGASDDGAAVAAIIEIARMLQALPATRNDVIFLITDAEEEGMFGASEFVRKHPWANEVKIAINLEARGTSGLSLMFETSNDDAWLIPFFARHVKRPATSSLYYEVYTRLKNDTDFTVFKEHGFEGYNFAFVRYVQNYHTANDDYEHADPGSLQHQGDNAWQLLTALADFDLDQRTTGRAIYTDVLATFVVWWPASINLALAISILAATAAAGEIARIRGLSSSFNWRVFVAMPLPMISASLLIAHTGIFGEVSVENPLPTMVGYWVLSLLALIGICRYTPLGRTDMWSAWSGIWFCWNALGLAAAWFAAGVSYLFLLPGAVAALAGLFAALMPARMVPRGLLAASCLGPIAAGVLWLPMQILLCDGIGFMFNPVYPICAGILSITALPLFTRLADPDVSPG
jgi:hypothetical protein